VIEQQWQANLTELQKSFNDLKLQFEFEVKDKDEQIQQLQQRLTS
jgi:hypothetical protein